MQYPMSDAHIPRNVTMHHITATTALVTYGYHAFVYQHNILNKLTTATLTTMCGFMCLC